MAARDVADGEGHGQDREAEGQRHPDKADAQCGEGGSQRRRSAAPQNQPGCSDEFCCQFAGHDRLPFLQSSGRGAYARCAMDAIGPLSSLRRMRHFLLFLLLGLHSVKYMN